MIGPLQVAARWLRRYAFVASADPRIGAEAELIVHDAASRRPAPLHGPGPALVPFLESFARAHGWTVLAGDIAGDGGAPRLCAPAGGCITLEPGGQLEYATPPHATPRALHEDLERTLRALHEHADGCGLALIAAGIDPLNDVDAAPILLDSPRYTQMAAYFAAIGPAGARMMRQTAAFQVNLDSPAPADTFAALNALAPVLVAAFANSPRHAGQDTGCASFRAENWRHVDPTRTGLLPEGPPHETYALFALQAPAMLLPSTLRALPYAEHWRLGARADAWRAHLTTLFPEVRPRGYLELRSIDAQPPGALALPLVVVSVVARDAEARRRVREVVGPADPALLATAGREGLRSPRLAALFQEVATIALEAARRHGADRYGAMIDQAEDEIRARMPQHTGGVPG